VPREARHRSYQLTPHGICSNFMKQQNAESNYPGVSNPSFYVFTCQRLEFFSFVSTSIIDPRVAFVNYFFRDAFTCLSREETHHMSCMFYYDFYSYGNRTYAYVAWAGRNSVDHSGARRQACPMPSVTAGTVASKSKVCLVL
jgi:hypothetical protein